MFLTNGDLRKITGIHSNTLDRWVNANLLQPANSGQGTGRHRIFSLIDAVAVAAGLRYRDAGAGPDRVAGVVRLLAGMSLEKLEAEFDAGRIFPVPAMLLGDAARPDCWIDGMMVEPPANMPKEAVRLLNLKKVYREVLQKAEKLHPPVKQKRSPVLVKKK